MFTHDSNGRMHGRTDRRTDGGREGGREGGSIQIFLTFAGPGMRHKNPNLIRVLVSLGGHLPTRGSREIFTYDFLVVSVRFFARFYRIRSEIFTYDFRLKFFDFDFSFLILDFRF